MSNAPRVLIIGRSGQLARALVCRAPDDVTIRAAGRPDTDLERPETLRKALDTAEPDLVINAGAYTAVDTAENDESAAYAINAHGPANLAKTCAQTGIPLVHISTDCVFDGEKATPYEEDDAARPLGIYGRSKLAGEEAVRANCEKCLVVRVSWVFSRFGRNFVKTMLALAETRDRIQVVCDQIGCPTHAEDLADGLFRMSLQAAQPDFNQWGLYHLAGTGETDRASMAEHIFADSRRLGGPFATIEPVPTRSYPTPARRPLNARLDAARAEGVFGVRLPHWRDRLTATVSECLGSSRSME